MAVQVETAVRLTLPSGDENARYTTKFCIARTVATSPAKCEEVFLNRPLVIGDDEKHSGAEERLYALGHTDAGRELFVVFTIRGRRIRLLSARDMSRKERKVYRSS